MELGKEGQQKMETIFLQKNHPVTYDFFSHAQVYYFLSIQLNPYSAMKTKNQKVPLNKGNQRVKPGNAMLKANPSRDVMGRH